MYCWKQFITLLCSSALCILRKTCCSGQAAALAGGTTMHIDFALPVNHNLMAGFKEWQAKAQLACADYGFHMAVIKWDAQVAEDMGKLVQQGINSFKFFMAYKVSQGRCNALVSSSGENQLLVGWSM
jgi:dihydroorotase-like cyclic amidohydrolase